MKKVFIGAMMLVMTSAVASAQSKKIIEHLGVGVEVGTTGVGVQVAVPYKNLLEVRAGLNYFPVLKSNNFTVDISEYNDSWNENSAKARELQNKTQYMSAEDASRIEQFAPYVNLPLPDNVNLEGKVGGLTGKLLVDVFPIKKSSFRVTGGLYFGSKKFVSAYTTNCEAQFEGMTMYNELLANRTIQINEPNNPYSYTFGKEVGFELDNYTLKPYGKKVESFVAVNTVRPYIGIGFGRAVPRTRRLAVAFDLGAQFWGSPKFKAEQKGGAQTVEKGVVNNEVDDVITIASKFICYPCLSISLNGQIF